jgi:uncharacterized protein (TIGR00725 family)
MAVIGAGSAPEPAVQSACEALGELAIEAGFRVATGGLGGVMQAVSMGARRAKSYREGDVVGIVPSYDRQSANQAVDIVIATGLGIARNVVLVASADVVVAVGGGSGTLSELAIAWQLDKPIVALAAVEGWSRDLAGRAIDDRRTDRIASAESPEQAVALALELTASG